MQQPNTYVPYSNPVQQFDPVQQDTDRDLHKKQMLDMCKRYHHHFVQIEAADGSVYEGIIDGTDDDHMYLLVPSGDMDDDVNRQYPYGGYPYGGYMYGRYPRRFRRFRRHRFPFFGFRRLFFPFFF
jgi:hypothetical protein